MLTLLVPAGWILFDVLICLRTGYMTGPFPRWEWWLWLISGLVLAALSIVAQWRERKNTEREMAEVKAGQEQHSKEHDILAGAALKTLDRGSNLALLVEKLEDLTNTHGKPIVTTIEMATERIGRLEERIAKSEAIFWGALTSQDKTQLATALAALGTHSVSVTAHENTDCVELARDLKDCFRRAGWEVARIPLTGTWMSAGASGFSFTTKASEAKLQRPLLEALVGVIRGPVRGMGSPQLPDEQEAKVSDFSILIGPKRMRMEDD